MNPELLDAIAHQLETIRTDAIFHPDNVDGVLDWLAQSEFLQAMGLLDAAVYGLRKASILQSRALAERQRM